MGSYEELAAGGRLALWPCTGQLGVEPILGVPPNQVLQELSPFFRVGGRSPRFKKPLRSGIFDWRNGECKSQGCPRSAVVLRSLEVPPLWRSFCPTNGMHRALLFFVFGFYVPYLLGGLAESTPCWLLTYRDIRDVERLILCTSVFMSPRSQISWLGDGNSEIRLIWDPTHGLAWLLWLLDFSHFWGRWHSSNPFWFPGLGLNP